MKRGLTGNLKTLGALLLATVATTFAATGFSAPAWADDALKGGTVKVAIPDDMTNFDPMQFSSVNFFLIKNLYDGLIEYDASGKAEPSLATGWKIADDSKSVTVTLRDDAKFPDGSVLTSADVAATLTKASDPKKGKNVYATMGIVKDWSAPDPKTIVINFKDPVPEKQITDLLEFTLPIEAKGIDTVETVPAGAGPYLLADRKPGQSVTLKANPNYWRKGQPVSPELDFTVFPDDASASAALESGTVDAIYGGQARSAVRLRDEGFQLVEGPGPLTQVFRINATHPPFDNASFRQAFNYLMDREGMLKVGYAGLGKVVALPWAPSSPAYDASYTEKYAYNLDKAKELLKASGLTPEQMSNWKLLVYGTDAASVALSQIAQSSLAKVGINIQLDVKQSAEYTQAQLAGSYDATFGGVGNIQKFPTRVGTNSIYRPANNPVLKDPHPFPDYVAAIDQVNHTTDPAKVKAAYDNLNQVLVKDSFAVPTNTYDTGLLVASPKLGGLMLDIDDILVGRTIGFK